MREGIALAATLMYAVTGAATADLPRSWSFRNDTETRIVPRLTEGSDNEKEVEFGDADNDGDLDIVIAVGSSDFGERRNKLYLNDGGVFNEVSGTDLIPEFTMEDVSRNAFFRDFNQDGWNDIYIINDSNEGGWAGKDKMYIALHKDGVLVGYSEEGDDRIPQGGDLGAACGAVAADFDYDGDMDVYSGNYPGPSQDRGLYNEGGTGNLADVTGSMIPADNDYTVDVAIADMNGDGKMDLLISNDGDPNYVYYNDNGGNGSGPGDFRYTGSTQNMGLAGARENSMEPADFDNDGDPDIYWTNALSSTRDAIVENTGNDKDGKAVLVERDVLPTSVTAISTRKATVADFNDDGRIDVFVAAQSGGRPVVLRNVSTGAGDFSFVDWSPAPAIPSNSLRGWHGAAFDTGGDGDIDILIGAFNDDHLLENVRANEVDEDDLGPLPAFWNDEPVAVTGRGVAGDTDVYEAGTLATGLLSIVLNGPDDYVLEVLRNDVVIETIDRGGLGVEEAVQVRTSTADYAIRVSIDEATCTPPDFNGDCEVDFNDLLALLANWGCEDCRYDMDGGGAGFSDLLLLLTAWGTVDPVNDYLLEVLGRTG